MDEQNNENSQEKEEVKVENNTQNSNSTNEKEGFNVSSEEVKKEAKQTVNEVKDTFKNTNFKKDSEAAKGFFISFFKNPLGEIKKVATDTKPNFLKIAIIVLVLWLVIIIFSNVLGMAINYLFSSWGSFSYFFRNLFSNILELVKDFIAPIITIAVLSGLTYGFMKNKNKSFLTIVSAITIAKIPVVISSIVSIISLFGMGITKLTSTFSSFCSVISTILLYFAIKHLSNESENDSYFWKFALIMGIFYIVKFVFSYLGIYL